MDNAYATFHFCGCWYAVPDQQWVQKRYLPQVDLSAHTTILANTSRTLLTQKFLNPSEKKLDEVQYTFPLYDGVSVVGFQCRVASRTITGVVKEKQQARAEYKQAVDRGETAGLLEQLPDAADAFTTRIGNVPPGVQIVVEIVYLGELKHDAETDGARFTIPTVIAPRYGSQTSDASSVPQNSSTASDDGGIRILVDVAVDEGSTIRGLQSPSHPISVTIGRTSSMSSDTFANHYASATLALGSTELEKDFIVVVSAKGQETPRALLERHPSVAAHRALMATLVPKFNLPSILPEIVFVVDRSGSMTGKIEILVSAMKIFLKSLPVGVKFNICSFGSNHTFLWPKSRSYDQWSLHSALEHLGTFSANYGGTEMYRPVKETVENRHKDMALEVMVITDGEIWNQQQMFDFINEATTESVRFFSLGIGDCASSSLVEGIARAGAGFAQFVAEGEKMDKRVVRMLKGALTPHIKNYTLEVQYDKDDEEFELVESVTATMKGLLASPPPSNSAKTVVSLFDPSAEETPTNSTAGRYDHLPAVNTPKLLQAPHKIPSLYPFNRTTVYLLMSPESCQRTPKAVILRATSEHGPLELEIPVQDVGVGETIHQLATKKAIQELEEGRGWITEAEDDDGNVLKEKHEGRMEEMVEREAVRLGVQFQVGGKWCSFVAVEADSKAGGKSRESESYATPMFDGGRDETFRLSPAMSKRGQYSGTPFSLFAPPRYGPSAALHSGGSLAACGARTQGVPARPFSIQSDPGVPFGKPQAFGGSAAHQFGGSVGAAKFGSASPAAQMECYFQIDADTEFPRFGSAAVASATPPAFGSSVFGGSTATAPPPFGASAFGGSTATAMPAFGASVCGDSTATATPAFGASVFGGSTGGVAAKKKKRDLSSEYTLCEPSSLQTNEDRMRALIGLQSFDGSWKWEDELFTVLGIEQAKLEAIFSSVVDLAQYGGAVKATVAAVAFLQGKMSAEADVWEMVVDKALGWLKTASASGFEEVKRKIRDLMVQGRPGLAPRP